MEQYVESHAIHQQKVVYIPTHMPNHSSRTKPTQTKEGT